MMREKTIEKIVREFIAKELTISPETIEPEANLVNDLHADSMDIVNVVTAIESRFKITFPDDTQIPYEGYTLKFLVEGVQKALRAKAPIRKVARVATAKAGRVKQRTKSKSEVVIEKAEELGERFDNKVETTMDARTTSRKVGKKADKKEN